MREPRLLLQFLLWGGTAFTTAAQSPWPVAEYAVQKHVSRSEPRQLHPREVAPGIQVKIMPMGDSITQGFQSTSGNGYRLDLLNDLKSGGSQVLFVGTDIAYLD
jgi:hypothetical protein